jgi:hypothetical protein
MKVILRHIFFWSWIVTLPITIMGGYLAYKSLDRFLTFSVRYDPKPSHANLYSFGRYEIETLLQKSRNALGWTGIYGSFQSKLEPIHLFASEANLQRLNAHLPQSGFQYIKGLMNTGVKFDKIKLRYRGDFIFHWGWEKKSIRIKTKKSSLFRGLRTFNLNAPKFSQQLHNFLAYSLASEMELVTPRTDLVRVFLNGEDRGVHILVEQIKELTLRNRDLMPGDIYRGEIIAKDRWLDGGINSLFDTPSGWDKISINDHYDSESNAALEQLLDLVRNRNSEAAQAKLSKLLDMKIWGRFNAFETLASTFHFLNDHNWRLYYDPWRQKLIPIVWDPVGWAPGWQPKQGKPEHMDIIGTELHRALFNNGDFLRARQKAFEEFFRSGKSGQFLDLAHRTVTLMTQEVQTDPLLKPANPKLVSDHMRRLVRDMQKVFSDLKAVYVNAAANITYDMRDSAIALVVKGRRPVWRLRLDFDAPLASRPKIRVRYKSLDQWHLVDISGAVSLSGRSLTIETGLLPDITPALTSRTNAVVRPGYYEFLLDEATTNAHLRLIAADQGNGWHSVPQNPSLKVHEFHGLYMPVLERPFLTPEIWRDQVIVEGVKTIDRPLIIEPGTTVLMDEGASLIITNRITAKGTTTAPIRFLPRISGQKPWGTVALLGRSADHSSFAHCEMAEGSGLKGDLYEYSAMLSVHDAKDVTIQDCLFRDNKRVDDMVHAVYATIRFDRSIFRRAFSDALDLDISEVEIHNSVFEDSGNDSVDLMATRAGISGTKLHNSGDKGISVGENSTLLAVNNFLTGNAIAVQAKDGSVALLFNQTLEGNKKSLDAYKKNWRYGTGGTILVSKSVISGNTKPITADKHSAIRLFDSFVDEPKFGKRVLALSAVDAKSRRRAAADNFLPSSAALAPKIDTAIQSFAPAILEKRNAKIRGMLVNDTLNTD